MDPTDGLPYVADGPMGGTVDMEDTACAEVDLGNGEEDDAPDWCLLGL